MSEESLVEFLSSVELFSCFNDQELKDLSEQAEIRNYDFGDAVYNTGDPGDGLFVIKSGSVRIFTEEQGKEVSMGVRKQGEVFSEIAMLRDYPQESSVR